MLAPKKGSDFRQDVMDSLNDLSDNVGEMISEGREKFSMLVDLGSEELEQETSETAWKTGRRS